jgi:hypothetical protein
MSVDQYTYYFHWVGLAIPLLIGLVLIFFRPYWAFLFATFVAISFSNDTLVFTRTEELGAYFNVFDALLIISLLAFIMDRKPRLVLPSPVIALVSVLSFGALFSALGLGFSLGILRIYRLAVTLPIEFFLAANLVYDEKRIRALLLVLIAGALVAEIQHLFLVFKVSELTEDTGFLRTIKFYMAGSESWLLAGPYIAAGSIPHPFIQLGIGALFLAANLTHQTRSIALAFVVAMFGFYLWFTAGTHSYRWKRFKIILVVIGITMMVVIPSTLLKDLTYAYGNRLAKTVTREDPTAGLTRINAFKVEMHDWLSGNPLVLMFGNGLGYWTTPHYKLTLHRRDFRERIAWGHLGYISYLSQFGILGFLIYGIWFPVAVLRRARRLVKLPGLSPAVMHLALLTGACFILQAIMFLFTHGYLVRYFLPGLLGGSLWIYTMGESEYDQGNGSIATPENGSTCY